MRSEVVYLCLLEALTDFGSKFIRRPSGGQFSVKVAAVKRNANQSLSVTLMEHDIPTLIQSTIPTIKSRDGAKDLHLMFQDTVSNFTFQQVIELFKDVPPYIPFHVPFHFN